ncbi:hypothetical protein ZIOFF_058098 [Zingiber officinale]|uniref:Uncharacterized protein n=1 Tax=Zingiber officinale TaxID=94328 RepID=A0A8J5FDT6_ZINOF|nr:hypothetical protein ZIOFF_058098 [Zingiber officinale]
MGGGNQLSPSEGMNKEPARSDHQVQDELKEVADTTPSPGEGQELSDEDESMVNEVAEDSKTNQIRDAAQPPGSPHKQPPPLAGSVIRWERILPVRTLKILLVENDDSTRQVVSALLRNCSYEDEFEIAGKPDFAKSLVSTFRSSMWGQIVIPEMGISLAFPYSFAELPLRYWHL